MRRTALLASVVALSSACELQEVTIAEAEPFVVAEAYLLAGFAGQRIALHASAGDSALLSPDAIVQLHAADTTIPFHRADVERCLAPLYSVDDENFPGGLACYEQEGTTLDPEAPPAYTIAPGALYRLSVQLADGSRVDGATRVPQQVAFASDAGSNEVCYLEPWTQLELSWNAADGTAAFVLDLEVSGLRDALGREGDEEIPDPLILRGLAIGTRDTTIVLPAEFGVFDRFALDPEVALALQQGLPEGVDFQIALAAVDQNFVDWVRGGDFNPSGLIRTPSMFGDGGTGVLGSMTIDVLNGTTSLPGGPDPDPPPPPPPACGS